MDNANKIKGKKAVAANPKKDESLQTTNVFLPEDALRHESRPPEYNLGQELAKASRKKDFLFHLASLLFVVVVVGVAYLLTTYITQRNQKVEVNIQEFDSFNLAELVQQATHDKENLDQAIIDREILKQEQDALLQTMYNNAKDEKELLKEQNLPADEKAQKLKEFNTEVEKKVAKLKEEFSAKLAQKDSEIQELQAKVEKQQSVLASKNTNMISTSNSGKLTEIQLNKQKKLYEDRMSSLQKTQMARIKSMRSSYQKQIISLTEKYNPIYKTGALSEILAQPSPQLKTPYEAEYSAALKTESIMSKDEYATLQKQIADKTLLLKELRKVPYTNSVPSTLEKIDTLSQSIEQKYQDMWAGLSIGVLKRDQMIDAYQYALNSHSDSLNEKKGWIGYVIDARRPQAVLLYLKSPEDAKDGDIVYVKNDADKTVLKLQLHPIKDSSGSLENKLNSKTRILAEVLEGNISDVKPFLRVSKNAN